MSFEWIGNESEEFWKIGEEREGFVRPDLTLCKEKAKRDEIEKNHPANMYI